MRSPVVIVTGASKGIGLATLSILLTKFNATCISFSRSITPELRDLASDRLLALECDVADESAVKDCVEKAIGKYHYIDGLVLNAGTLDPICRIGDDIPISEWKKNFDINFFSLVTVIQATLPSLRTSELGGRIVFVSSGAAVKGFPGWGPYNASKAALNSLCRTIAEEEPSIFSVAVRPGVVNTAMQGAIRENGASAMGSGHQPFLDLHTNGLLLEPEAPGHVLAALALQCPAELSGRFVSWDEDVCRPFVD
ncbi:hypothetical protein D9757_002727 [Collybiopsis confluens]|uniref:Short-chain dehydrogenase n=1 Tax=Collybiopsis confluens TaxID=2823264 RepID=A0A8H5HW77_9AGAR|nr:hypothetical protein D9757_002727 [Collybiopsis confluens]